MKTFNIDGITMRGNKHYVVSADEIRGCLEDTNSEIAWYVQEVPKKGKTEEEIADFYMLNLINIKDEDKAIQALKRFINGG